MTVNGTKLRHLIYEYGKNINFNFSNYIYFGQTPSDLNLNGVGMCFSVCKGHNLSFFQKYCNKNALARAKELKAILKKHSIPFTKKLVKGKTTESRQYYTTFYFIPLSVFGVSKVKE